MSSRGFIELTSKCSSDMLRKLISAAHEASRQGAIVLALNGVSRQAVNGYLEMVTRLEGAEVGDLRFLPARGIDEQLLAEAADADFVIAQSSALSAALFSRGTRYMAAAKGLRFLRAGTSADDAFVPAPHFII